MVTAVKRYKPTRGSDSVLYSEDRQREEKAKQMGLLCTYGQRESQHKHHQPEITACGWTACRGEKHQPFGAAAGQKPHGERENAGGDLGERWSGSGTAGAEGRRW